jgi:hypothetical protein
MVRPWHDSVHAPPPVIPEEIIEQYNLAVNSFRWLGLHRNPQRHAWTQTGRKMRTTVSPPRQVRLHPSSPRSLPLKHHTRDIVFALVVDDFGSGTPIRTTPTTSSTRSNNFCRHGDWFGSLSSASLSVGLHQTEQSSSPLHPAALARFHIPCQISHSLAPLLQNPVIVAPSTICGDTPDSPLPSSKGTNPAGHRCCVVVVPMRRRTSQCHHEHLGSEQVTARTPTPNPSTPGFHGHHYWMLHQSDMVRWVLATAPTSATATPQSRRVSSSAIVETNFRS